ncbi:DUF3152 domain-containing protein [Streptomyces gobiensis]|uniref:DUF3152 domain-containing protein n=1 Tax=Streptomyces gobiensis TaxID=2875706 RepID=UPI0030D5DE8F
MEAFEGLDDDVFAAGAPEAPSAGKPPAARTAAQEPPPEEPGRRDDFAKGRRGRTVTGIVAAAIATVLAAVVAGQMATERREDPPSAGGVDRTDPGKESQADGRPGPAEPPGALPMTYEQQMAQIFQLDPKLKGSGKLSAVAGHDKAPGSGQKLTYRVDIEDGIGLDGKLFAEAVQKTLTDKRSWSNDGVRTFERVSSGPVDFVITLASPATTAVWCAKSGLDTTEDNVSCDSAATERVMINAYRWARGAETFGPEKMHLYRQMLINHEVGHRLGFGHVGCPRDGAPAPVMMQQTKFLTTGDATCRPNAWPFPKG